MISRGFTWINEDEEHSDSDHTRAKALAEKWSALMTQAEQRRFQEQADLEDGREPEFESTEEMAKWLKRRAEVQAERDLEIEIVEEMLARIGARMMRPYEHWNEDERYVQYMETRYDEC